MQGQIQKWGNSLALRIPKALAAEAGVSEGSAVEIELGESGLVIRPLPEPTYSLRELVAGITEENRHGEVDSGPAVGKEVW
jgi:antitoxin MazE